MEHLSLSIDQEGLEDTSLTKAVKSMLVRGDVSIVENLVIFVFCIWGLTVEDAVTEWAFKNMEDDMTLEY